MYVGNREFVNLNPQNVALTESPVFTNSKSTPFFSQDVVEYQITIINFMLLHDRTQNVPLEAGTTQSV